MNQNDGGPAFPNAEAEMWEGSHYTYLPRRDGMTLRDYFAAAALLSAGVNLEPKQVAQQAYAVADAMLAEREK